VEPTTVYVEHRWRVIVWGLFAVVAVGFGVKLLVTATGIGVVLVGIAFLGAAAWRGRRTLRAIRYARSGLPILRLDEDGLECVYGRIHWADVLFVSSEEITRDTWLLFIVRPGTAWELVEPSYSPYLVEQVERRGASALRVGLWTKKRKAIQLVNSYYQSSGDLIDTFV